MGADHPLNGMLNTKSPFEPDQEVQGHGEGSETHMTKLFGPVLLVLGLVIGIIGSLIMGKIRRRKMESMLALQTDSSESDGSITDASDIEQKRPMHTSTSKHPSIVVERTNTTEIHGKATASQLAF